MRAVMTMTELAILVMAVMLKYLVINIYAEISYWERFRTILWCSSVPVQRWTSYGLGNLRAPDMWLPCHFLRMWWLWQWSRLWGWWWRRWWEWGLSLMCVHFLTFTEFRSYFTFRYLPTSENCTEFNMRHKIMRRINFGWLWTLQVIVMNNFSFLCPLSWLFQEKYQKWVWKTVRTTNNFPADFAWSLLDFVRIYYI